MDFASLSGARVVDLSLAVSERLPGTWPGHMTYAHHNWNWFAKVEGPTGTTRSTDPYRTNFDAPSIGSAHDSVPVHQEGLGRGMRYVEILTNLGALPARGAYFIFMQVKIADSSGGPGRAMALLPG